MISLFAIRVNRTKGQERRSKSATQGICFQLRTGTSWHLQWSEVQCAKWPDSFIALTRFFATPLGCSQHRRNSDPAEVRHEETWPPGRSDEQKHRPCPNGRGTWDYSGIRGRIPPVAGSPTELIPACNRTIRAHLRSPENSERRFAIQLIRPLKQFLRLIPVALAFVLGA